MLLAAVASCGVRSATSRFRRSQSSPTMPTPSVPTPPAASGHDGVRGRCDRTGEDRADRRRPGEDRGVDAHDAAAQLIRDDRLDRGVPGRRHADRAESRQRQGGERDGDPGQDRDEDERRAEKPGRAAVRQLQHLDPQRVLGAEARVGLVHDRRQLHLDQPGRSIRRTRRRTSGTSHNRGGCSARWTWTSTTATT